MITGCQAGPSDPNNDPVTISLSSKTVNDAVRCLIPSLEKSYNSAKIGSSRFVSHTVVNEEEYEITVTGGLLNVGTPVVKVTQTSNGTAISLVQNKLALPWSTLAMKDGISVCL